MRDDWSTLRKLMFQRMAAGGRLIEDTVTGNPAVFQTNVAKPLTGFTIPFLPVQQGTGDPSPSNVRTISGWSGVTAYRTGKNLINPATFTDGKVWYNGNMASGYANFSASPKIPVVPGATYFLSRETLNQNQVCFFDHAGNYLSQASWAINTAKTMGDGVYFVGFSLMKTDKETAQLEVGNEATAHADFVSLDSYPVTFPALGKNLFDKNACESGKLWWKGKKQDWASGVASGLIPVIPGQTYTLARSNVTQNQAMYFDEGGAYIDQDASHWTSTTATNTIPDGVYFIAFNVTYDSLDSAQFEKGSSATAYEPYTNTVYGGTLDAVTGVLSVEWAGFSKKWSEGESATDMGSGITRKTFPMVDYLTTGTANNMCNIAPYEASENARLHFYYSGSGSTNRKCRVFLPSDTPDTTEITVITKLSQTYEIPLSDIPVPVTLIGDNTIWTDTNGENTIRYKKKG